MNKKVILHFNNYCITGGVPAFIIYFALTFPEFQHIMCSVKEPEEYELARYIQYIGIRYFNAPIISRDIIEYVRPTVVMLHNITSDRVDGIGYDVFYDTRVVLFHHNHIPNPPQVVAEDTFYPSKWVKNGKEGTLVHPCVYSPPYLSVVRPRRDRMVIGRIQSGTRGGVQDEVIELFKQVQDTDMFIVGKNSTEGSGIHRIKPGAMPEYLSNIEVLALWTSGTESWSMVTTEASLSGIPVVALDQGDGLSEQLKQSQGGKLLVKTKEEFIKALEFCRDNPDERQRIATNARSWCLEHASDKALRKLLTDKLLGWI